MYVPFESLPGHTRLWIYQANRKFTAQESSILSEALGAFTQRWAAHGTPLKTSFAVLHNQFVILAADEEAHGASGCSIDDSVRTVKELGHHLAIDFFDRTLVAFRKAEGIVTLPLSELKSKFEDGVWASDTLTFNNLVPDKATFDSQWLVPAGSTWLKRYLPKETVTT